MPELPDIAAYISALEARIVGQPLEQVRLASPFLLRTVQPPVAAVEGKMVRELRRIGKRIANHLSFHSGYRGKERWFENCGASASASRLVSKAISGWCCT